MITSKTHFIGRKGIGFCVGKAAINLVLYVLAISYVLPFVWMLYSSFKSKAEFTMSIAALPKEPVLDNYRQALAPSTGVYSALLNSVFNTVVSVTAIVVLSFMMAYLLNRFRFRGRNALYGFFMASVLIPAHSLLVPVYIQFNALKLVNTHFALLFPYITLGLPMAIFLFDSYLATVSRFIDEAAMSDGANILQTMFRVVFPICMPITGTILVLNIMSTWNEFSFALVLSSAEKVRTVPLWLTAFDQQYTSNITLKLTGLFLGCLPTGIVYLCFREKIMNGVAAGAIKG